MKAAAGLTQQRRMPAFARTNVQRLVRGARRDAKAARYDRRPPVVLWPDTFNNYFFPHTAKAAVEVLESAGYRVEVPHAKPVLRAPTLRLRFSRPGQRQFERYFGRAARADYGRCPRSCIGAKLRVRVSGRTDEHPGEQRGRTAIACPDQVCSASFLAASTTLRRR